MGRRSSAARRHGPAVEGSASLLGVDATAADDVWAVGGSAVMGQRTMRVVSHIQHWDGRQWRVVASPNAPGRYGGNASLYEVSARTPTDAWAVGMHLDGAGGERMAASITRWDGRRWSQVRAAPAPDARANLRSVDAVSAADAWTVGLIETATDVQPLVQRWDGVSWNRVTVLDTPGGSLHDVVAVSSDDVWAVGSQDGQPLILHWDGTRWSRESAELAAVVVWLKAVAVDATGNVRIVGQMLDEQDLWRSVTLHRGADGWVTEPMPYARDGMLNGLDFGPTRGFAVGEQITGDDAVPERAIIFHRATTTTAVRFP